nr:hypothetical protein [Tanacetum cinerariifolium]
KAYQEYYACTMGEASPKPKASARKKKGERTGSKPGVPDVPSDDSEEELSNKGSDNDSEKTVKSGAGKDGDEDDDEDDDDDDEEEELSKDDEKDKETGKSGDEVRESEGESEEEEGSFDLIPRTPEDRVESIFTTTSSQIVSLEPPTPIMTPSTIATITTSGEAPIPPPTIPSTILENLPTFNSAFRFEERLRLLETSFSEYRQTNQFADDVSAIPDIIHRYMDQQIKKAV